MSRGGVVSVRSVRNPREKGYRVAVVVSRKVSKSAVVRNRIRRRIYELVRVQLDTLTEPYDLVFTVYDAAVAELSHSRLSQSVTDCLRKAGVLADGRTRSDHAIIENKETTA